MNTSNPQDMAHLVAQAHGLYLRLRDRANIDESFYPVATQAYQRYRRRVMRFHARDLW
jgi:hypothetical protein